MSPVRAWCIALPSLAVAGALGLAAGMLFFFEPSHYHVLYPVCTFHQWTGLLCPGCGSLRAMHQLLHGQVLAALHLNALFVLSLPLLGWLAVRFVRCKLRRQPAALAVRPAWLWCALAALIAFAVLRNLPFAQQAWLAP